MVLQLEVRESSALCCETMTGPGMKQRMMKTKTNSFFKKIFSFKQKSQSSHNPSDHTRQLIQKHCEGDTSTCSSTADAEGLLVFPVAQRLTTSSPPAAVLDSIPGLNHTNKKQFLLRQHSSPYQSKASQKNLSDTLKTCRKSGSEKHFMNCSPWERMQPSDINLSIRSTPQRLSLSRSKGSGITEIRRSNSEDMDIAQTESSNSLFLPPEVSPANKFVPIGLDEFYNINTFHSEDYDICNEDVEQPAPAAAANSTAVNSTPKPTDVGDDASVNTNDLELEASLIINPVLVTEPAINKSCSGLTDGDFLLESFGEPPSPATTEGTSGYSSDSLIEKDNMDDDRYSFDKYCACLDEEEENWFPQIKQEIMKLSTVFESNCSASNVNTTL